jgi:adenosylcobinamide amidohydrolase
MVYHWNIWLAVYRVYRYKFLHLVWKKYSGQKINHYPLQVLSNSDLRLFHMTMTKDSSIVTEKNAFATINYRSTSVIPANLCKYKSWWRVNLLKWNIWLAVYRVYRYKFLHLVWKKYSGQKINHYPLQVLSNSDVKQKDVHILIKYLNLI